MQLLSTTSVYKNICRTYKGLNKTENRRTSFFKIAFLRNVSLKYIYFPSSNKLFIIHSIIQPQSLFAFQLSKKHTLKLRTAFELKGGLTFVSFEPLSIFISMNSSSVSDADEAILYGQFEVKVFGLLQNNNFIHKIAPQDSDRLMQISLKGSVLFQMLSRKGKPFSPLRNKTRAQHVNNSWLREGQEGDTRCRQQLILDLQEFLYNFQELSFRFVVLRILITI